jgi:hypothetical protein
MQHPSTDREPVPIFTAKHVMLLDNLREMEENRHIAEEFRIQFWSNVWHWCKICFLFTFRLVAVLNVALGLSIAGIIIQEDTTHPIIPLSKAFVALVTIQAAVIAVWIYRMVHIRLNRFNNLNRHDPSDVDERACTLLI